MFVYFISIYHSIFTLICIYEKGGVNFKNSHTSTHLEFTKHIQSQVTSHSHNSYKLKECALRTNERTNLLNVSLLFLIVVFFPLPISCHQSIANCMLMLCRSQCHFSMAPNVYNSTRVRLYL